VALAAENANILDAGALVDEQAAGLKLRWIAADRSAEIEPVEGGRAVVGRVFRPAQRNAAKLLQLLGLLLLDERTRGKVPAGEERQRRRCQDEQTGKAWPLCLHA
jgi:hypothetical protein